jgi:hypothetical protein
LLRTGGNQEAVTDQFKGVRKISMNRRKLMKIIEQSKSFFPSAGRQPSTKSIFLLEMISSSMGYSSGAMFSSLYKVTTRPAPRRANCRNRLLGAADNN